MSDLDNWVEKNKPKQKKLSDYRDDIIHLKQLGFTQKKIVEYLQDMHNLTTNQMAISRLLRKPSGKKQQSKQTAPSSIEEDVIKFQNR